MNPRYLLPLVASALLVAGCGGSSSPSPSAARAPGQASSSVPAAGSAPSAAGSAAAQGSGSNGGAIAATTGAAASTSGSSTTGSAGAAPGAPAAKAGTTSTAPGTYTYDTSGTVTVGTPRDAAGTSTLTVDPAAGGRQHSALADSQGRTEQDVVVRTTGTFLARLAITNPAFSKEFRPAAPVLLVPDPASPGRSWSWTAKSTDGKTTAAVTARVARRETLTVGGEKLATSVVVSTLRLTGDVAYTGQMETWYDPVHRLTAKEHTKGSGTVSGVQFTTDITSVLRSTRPS